MCAYLDQYDQKDVLRDIVEDIVLITAFPRERVEKFIEEWAGETVVTDKDYDRLFWKGCLALLDEAEPIRVQLPAIQLIMFIHDGLDLYFDPVVGVFYWARDTNSAHDMYVAEAIEVRRAFEKQVSRKMEGRDSVNVALLPEWIRNTIDELLEGEEADRYAAAILARG